jgi:murein DD-endopeptidase MepM/ murein hydrolase activator NlpD
VLGLVGNSGNSTQPHLHFHVTDASSPLGSEGVPYAFDTFETRPAVKPGEKIGSAVRRSKQLPTEDEFVAFP